MLSYKYISWDLQLKVAGNKNLVLIILLLFVGQVVSAPFSLSSSNQSDSHSMSMMDMSSMSSHDMTMMHSSDSSDSSMQMDCCNDDCDCTMGLCFSVILISTDTLQTNVNLTNQVNISDSLFIFPQHSSSIYHPPIFS